MIRTADENDVGQLTILFDSYRVFYGKQADPASAKDFLSQRLLQRDSVIFVDEDDAGQLRGFVQLYPIFSSTRMKRLWLLNDLYVLEAARGQGISKLLIEAAKTWSRQTQSAGLLLETAKDNYIGNKLYPKTGFVLDTEHNYYFWSE